MYSQPIIRGHLLGQRKGDCFIKVITCVAVSVVSILYFVYMIEIIGFFSLKTSQFNVKRRKLESRTQDIKCDPNI